MCTPATSFTFAGVVTINGITTKYAGQCQSLPSLHSFTAGLDSFEFQGNTVIITTRTDKGQFVTVLKNVAGHITAASKFPNATSRRRASLPCWCN